MATVLIIDGTLTLARDLANDLVRSIPASSGPTRLDVTPEADFSKARARIKVKPPSLMVTALRLGEYNGLHLVYMAAAAGASTRCLVHTDTVDPTDARDVQAAGAFYEIRSRLRVALPAYVRAVLPSQDRRNPIRFDRRRLGRGGRRAADFHPSL